MRRGVGPKLNVKPPPCPHRHTLLAFLPRSPRKMPATPLPYRTAQITPETHLAYIDSWHDRELPLPTRYTTIVALHGVGFNSSALYSYCNLTYQILTTLSSFSPFRYTSAVWTPLLPSLPPSIRFLAYNQRSYAGSSPAFEAKPVGGTDATAAYLGDLLAFIKFAAEELGVPGVDDASGAGGISLLVGLEVLRGRRRDQRAGTN
jgi:pimeloyl-ACP methyl ester carboxylesterase